MPTTRPRRWRLLNGVDLTLTVDRHLAERVKEIAPGMKPLHPYRGHLPLLKGINLTDIDWYHTIELPDGQVTPGFVDHRDQIDLYKLPESLAGKRCLDVATFDGFWAFEMERRGAAEVFAIDVHSRADNDYPVNWQHEYLVAARERVNGLGFAFARRALRSNVERRVLSVYELGPREVGTFDFVFLSDLLLHLRDPIKALEHIWQVMKPGAQLVLAEPYDVDLDATGIPGAVRFVMSPDQYSGLQWWLPSVSMLDMMLKVARFGEIEEISRFDLHCCFGITIPKVVVTARRPG
jgi:tRNA (mo5U34)-methyltransferase